MDFHFIHLPKCPRHSTFIRCNFCLHLIFGVFTRLNLIILVERRRKRNYAPVSTNLCLICYCFPCLLCSVKKISFYFSSNAILVLVVNGPTDYYIAGMRSGLPNGWSHTVSDLRMANIPMAGLRISVDMAGYTWPITAIVSNGGYVHLGDLHLGCPPVVRTWQNCGGRFRYLQTRKMQFFSLNQNFMTWSFFIQKNVIIPYFMVFQVRCARIAHEPGLLRTWIVSLMIICFNGLLVPRLAHIFLLEINLDFNTDLCDLFAKKCLFKVLFSLNEFFIL